MKKIDQYLTYIILALSLMLNIFCGLKMQNLDNEIETLKEYNDSSLKSLSIVVRQNIDDIHKLMKLHN